MFNFGGFSLGVLAAAVRDITEVVILEATEMTVNEAVEKTLALKPDLVGVTLMGFQSIGSGVDFVRALTPCDFPVVAGGHGSSMMPELLFEAGAGCVVFGEGELTLEDIVRNGIQPGMAGTIVPGSNGGPVIKGPVREPVHPLDNLKPPARELMPPPQNGVHLMETSRGCPHNCAFCETTRFFGVRWRAHSPERVAQEVTRLLDEYDGWLIQFADDNFAASVRRVKEICRTLIKEEALPAYFMISTRADDLIKDPELIPLMAEARILRVSVGIDTLDEDTSKAVNKTIPPETYLKAFREMRKHGIFSVGSAVVGLPGESPEARARTVEQILQVEPDSVQFLPYLPLPGLPRTEKHNGFESLEEDIRDAALFRRDFYMNKGVQDRLMEMAQGEDIQGQLARGTIMKIKRQEQVDG